MKKNRTLKLVNKILSDKDYERNAVIKVLVLCTLTVIAVGYFLSLSLETVSISRYVLTITIVALAVYSLLFFLYFVNTEIFRTQLINHVLVSADHIEHGGWSEVKSIIINCSERGHFCQSVLRHPITMFILGHALVNDNDEELGSRLIDEAKQHDSFLNNVVVGKTLTHDFIVYIHETIENEEKFKRFYFYKNAWSVGFIRNTVIIIGIIFLLLNILTQIVKITG